MIDARVSRNAEEFNALVEKELEMLSPGNLI